MAEDDQLGKTEAPILDLATLLLLDFKQHRRMEAMVVMGRVKASRVACFKPCWRSDVALRHAGCRQDSATRTLHLKLLVQWLNMMRLRVYRQGQEPPGCTEIKQKRSTAMPPSRNKEPYQKMCMLKASRIMNALCAERLC